MTNKLLVRIAELYSTSLLGSKSNLHPEVIRMLPNAVRHAEQKESRPTLEAAVIAAVVPAAATMGLLHARCSRRNAPPVGKILKYLLNRAPAGRSIARIVIVRRTRIKDTNYQ